MVLLIDVQMTLFRHLNEKGKRPALKSHHPQQTLSVCRAFVSNGFMWITDDQLPFRHHVLPGLRLPRILFEVIPLLFRPISSSKTLSRWKHLPPPPGFTKSLSVRVADFLC